MGHDGWTVTIVAVVALLLVNQCVSSLRFYVIGRAFSVPAALARAHRVNLSSIAGSMLLFNFLGQGLTRAVLFRELCVSRSVMFLITALERALSFALLIGIGAVALLGAYGTAALDASALLGFGLVCAALATGLAVAFWRGLGRRARREAALALRGALLGWLALAATLTLTMHAAMLSGYVLLASHVLGVSLDSALITAAVLTMLGAAFPVAPGGWGARELTSVYAFSLLGGSAAQGVEIGVTIGLLSVAALIANLGLVWLVGAGRRTTVALKVDGVVRAALSLRRLRAFCWIGPILVAVLAAFQAPLPIGDGYVTINAADPVAIVVALSAISLLLLGIVRARTWAVEGFAPGLAVLGLAVTAAFLIGFARYGLIEWALVNRLVGLGVAFCFLLSGAFLALVSGGGGVRRLARCLALVAATVVVIEFTVRLAGMANHFESLQWTLPTYAGFLGNRNAWALFLCVTIGASLALRAERRSDDPWLTAILIVGVILTGSRTGFVALPVLLVLLRALKLVSLGRLAVAVATLFGSAVLLDFTVNILPYSGVGDGHWSASALAVFGHVQPMAHIQADRWASIEGSWRMFLEHPLFGAGLGAFMREQLEATGEPLVIHSIYLWLLAEFGVVGAALFLAPVALIARQLIVDPVWRASDEARALMAVLAVLAVFGLTHDMAYQRIAWFMLGLLAARPAALRSALKRREQVEEPAAPSDAKPERGRIAATAVRERPLAEVA